MDKKIDLSNFQSNSYYEISYLDTESIVDSSFLKNFRKDNNLTQIRLANILGVSKKTIEKWEQGVNNIGGSSAVLLKLLNDNPELIAQLYSVNVGVTGKQESDEYQQIDLKVIKSTTKITVSRTLKGALAAIF